MRYLALATDYDATLAWEGTASTEAIDALKRLRASGRKTILVTGRELDDLLQVFPHPELFDRIVAENGALLYRPQTRERKPLGEPPPPALIDELRARSVKPLSAGSSIIATTHPHEATVVRTIRDLGLEHQVIFNKGSVMILPSRVNKGTGLGAALDELSLSPHNVVSIGDAENDHAFLSASECGVAVADALPTLKERADYVTSGGEGAGVAELIEMLLDDDLHSLEPRLTRHDLLVGTSKDGEEVRLRAYGTSLLVAGPSGSGKSTTTMGILEALSDGGYQFCLIDPEGDYGALEGVVTIGSIERGPTPNEVVQLLQRPTQSIIVNLTGLTLADRPGFFAGLLPRLQELRAQAGRPHWIVVDEAHHLLPMDLATAPQTVPTQLSGTVLITLEPDHVAPAALAPVDLVIAVGATPWETITSFADAVGVAPPRMEPGPVESGEIWAWSRQSGFLPVRLQPLQPRTEHLRHRRKYAEGDLGDESFFFKGPEGKLNLRAQNLMLFMQIAEGVDEDTWTYHLRRGDYSEWFDERIKDPDLAAEAARIEEDVALTASESRRQILEEIRNRYTAPA